MEEEEGSSCPCVEFEVPRESLLHRDQLISPLESRFEMFKGKKLKKWNEWMNGLVGGWRDH